MFRTLSHERASSILRPLLGFLALCLLTGVSSAQETTTAPTVTATKEVFELGERERLFEEIDNLRRGQALILREIRQLRARITELEQPAAAPEKAPEEEPAVIDIAGAPALGDADAPLVMIELSDYQCPFCARNHRETFPEIRDTYIDTGVLRYVFLDFPLRSHRHAPKAAEAAHCAGDQDRFWDMHDLLLENRSALEPENLPGYAAELGLDADAFRTCLDEERYAGRVSAAKAAGQEAGVRSTPTFLLGYARPGSTELEVVRTIRGAQGFSGFETAIEALRRNAPDGTGR